VYSGLASHTTLLSVSASTFSHLRNDLLATVLLPPVASLDAPKLFVAIETWRIHETGGLQE
jgi:hypothetical protein